MLARNNYGIRAAKSVSSYQPLKEQSPYQQSSIHDVSKQTFQNQEQKINNQSFNTPSHHKRSNSHNRNGSSVHAKQNQEQIQRLDNQFVRVLKDLQNYYLHLTKHEQIRVEKWIVKIIQNDETITWKCNRNNHLKLLFFVVKNYSTLIQPFDKMPQSNKDLPYLSDHELNQRLKPRFDGKSPSFHIKKPLMIKINEPVGDNFSVLMSLINTARTQTKENQHDHSNTNQNQEKNKIKHSQLFQGRSYFNQNSFIKVKSGISKVQQQRQNQNSCSNREGQNLRQLMDISSVIPSNLPSQVKSIYNESVQTSRMNEIAGQQRQKSQRHMNHKKYSQKNSRMESGILANRLNSSFLQKNSSSLEQLTVYKELILTMGKLLLKHQYAIQRESEYWQLMRMIYSYKNSLKLSVNNHQNPFTESKDNDIHQNDRAYGSCQNRYNSRNQKLSQQKQQSFQQFLNNLKQQIFKDQQNKNQSMNSTSGNRYGANQQVRSNLYSDPQSNNFSERDQSNPTQSKRACQGERRTNCKRRLYNEEQAMNHITEQSLDFRVQEGVEPSQVLYYELNQKQSAQNSLMQQAKRSLTSQQCSRKLGNKDYHNIYRAYKDASDHRGSDQEINNQEQEIFGQEQEQLNHEGRQSEDQLYYKEVQSKRPLRVGQKPCLITRCPDPYVGQEEQHLILSNNSSQRTIN